MHRRNSSTSLRSLAAIGAATLAALGSRDARADETPDYAHLTDEELLAIAEAQGEIIVVWDERPEKPFDRDTTLRLTDADLAGRGVAHLGDALALVPEVTVRAAGRGGQLLDIRGARKGAIHVIVDGVPLEDPYYGTFDLSSIPITDIVQVRVATSPSSPIDGPGGPGGVVEVHTRDAIGDRLVVARASGDTLPTAGAAASGRGHLAPALGLRLSATGTLGDHSYAVPGGTADDDQHYGGAAMRLEWRPPHQEARRAVLDVSGYDRGYLVPPAAEEDAVVTQVDREDGARAVASFEDRAGAVRWVARAHASAQSRMTRYFADATMTEETNFEDLRADREGASLVANRPLARTMQLVAAAHLDTEAARVVGDGSRTTGRATIGELAAGWQAARGAWKVDSAAGLALPIGVGAAPWPEGKLAVSAAPVDAVTFTATLARKGRLPTLRERFRPDVGNAALDPEQTSFGELKVAVAPGSRVTVESAAWLRRQEGMILADRMTRRLVNLGEVDFVGIDARADLRASSRATLGAAWSFILADDATADEPLDNLPRNRLTGQLRIEPHRRVTTTARLRWTAERIDRGVTLPSYADLEAEVLWAATAHWQVAARAEDLLDRRWEIRAGVPSEGRTFTISVQGALH